ncbi:MAG: DedA family protein [Alphaproteobacteria bacterium]|nr:DedA family protein [Alphaproteobacteria bacterium]
MLRGLYDWVIRMAEHPKSLWVLFGVSFAESSFFPIPPDVMLIPMILAKRAKAWLIAGVCTIASVIGGFFGYAIGYFLFETIGQWVINLYGLQGGFAQFQEQFNKWGLWIILIKGMTPIPYKLITIASGAAHFNLAVFAAASLLTRGARFYLVAALLYFFGEPIRSFIEKHLTLVTTAAVVLIVAGFVVVSYLH